MARWFSIRASSPGTCRAAGPTGRSELEEAGSHLVRAGEVAVREAEPAIAKAPDRFVDYARQHPWLTLMFGAACGVFLTKYVQKRRGE
jgi:ElaB/YqjD/DUF883 family membrane-anchored ribosome-binding protein